MDLAEQLLGLRPAGRLGGEGRLAGIRLRGLGAGEGGLVDLHRGGQGLAGLIVLVGAVIVDRDRQQGDQENPADGIGDGPDVAPGILDAPADDVGEFVALDLFAGETLVHQTGSGKGFLPNFSLGKGAAHDTKMTGNIDWCGWEDSNPRPRV